MDTDPAFHPELQEFPHGEDVPAAGVLKVRLTIWTLLLLLRFTPSRLPLKISPVKVTSSLSTTDAPNTLSVKWLSVNAAPSMLPTNAPTPLREMRLSSMVAAVVLLLLR